MSDAQQAKKKTIQVNEILKARGQRIQMAGIKSRLESLKHTDLVAFNSLAEQAFVELIRGLIEENHLEAIPILDVRREASYELGISPETSKRYLESHTARRAELRLFGKLVFLNPNFAPLEPGVE